MELYGVLGLERPEGIVIDSDDIVGGVVGAEMRGRGLEGNGLE